MNAFLRRMAAATALIMLGLAILMYGLERLMIDHHASASMRATTEVAPELMVFFAGFVLVNLGVFPLLSRWASFYRSNPGLRQAPVSLLVGIVAVLGAAVIGAMALHADRMKHTPPGTAEISWGYILLVVVLVALLLLTLVFIAVRWSPGYHRRLGQVLPPSHADSGEGAQGADAQERAQTTTTERTS